MIVCAAVAGLALVGLTGSSVSANPPARQSALAGPHREGVPPLSHVFFLIGENTSYQDVTSQRAPFITNVLKPASAWLTTYSALHSGSTSDYIGLTLGQYLPCDVQDVNPSHHCDQNIPNLFSQLVQRGVSWEEWNESAANPCDFYDSGTDWAANIYGVHHNPAAYYDNIEGGTYRDDLAPSPECLANVVSTGTTGPDDMSWFNTALAAGSMPRFNFVIPNDCQNGHDVCGRSTDPVTQFDRFLAQEVPKIEASPSFDANSVIVVTYDEWNDQPPPPHGDHRVAFLVLGGPVRPGVYGSGPYTHYSFLRTMEDAFALHGYLANAANALPINSIWRK